MTIIAGPGITIMTTPTSNTVNPTRMTTMRRATLEVRWTALLNKEVLLCFHHDMQRHRSHEVTMAVPFVFPSTYRSFFACAH